MAEATELERRFDEVYGSPEAYQPAKFEPIEQPQAALAKFVDAARLAKQVIEKAGFEIEISGRKYITAQGWSVLGSMFGLTVRTRSIEHRTTENGKAQVIAYVDVLRHGQVIGGAAGAADYEEASWRKDAGWENRPYSHLVSLAQTRATRKALQLLLSHIVALAGYEIEATAEEVAPTVVSESRQAIDPEALAKAIQKALIELTK
jgi:hypothetical protein